MEGQGFWQVCGIHLPGCHVAPVASLAEEELGLVILPQAAALFLYVTAKAEVVNRLCGQAEAVALVTVLRVDVLGVAISAVCAAGPVGVEGVGGICRKRRGQSSADKETDQEPQDLLPMTARLAAKMACRNIHTTYSAHGRPAVNHPFRGGAFLFFALVDNRLGALRKGCPVPGRGN